MRRLMMQFCIVTLILLIFSGCVAIRTKRYSGIMDESIKTTIVRSDDTDVYGIAPLVLYDGSVAKITLNLIGRFDLKTTTIYSNSSEGDGYIAFGLFPGVMSCKGEYGKSLQNGATALFYNLIFAGLPTVYGLIIEPFIPYYPKQTDSIVGKTAFLKSPIFGFSRYSKPMKPFEEAKNSIVTQVRLDDAQISAPDLGYTSVIGQPLEIPLHEVAIVGDFKVKFSLKSDHPLKEILADFENVEIKVSLNEDEK